MGAVKEEVKPEEEPLIQEEVAPAEEVNPSPATAEKEESLILELYNIVMEHIQESQSILDEVAP